MLVRVRECGVCGTDRDIVAGRYGRAPAGSAELILGHENLGVVERAPVGRTGFGEGDLVVATVRRGCGACRFCLAGRSDFCATGRFTERGIGGADGYFADAYVEDPAYVVRVPVELAGVAVLLEPLSVVEKALEEGDRVLRRREPTPGHRAEGPSRALVAGTGAIGLLAALVLRLRGWDVVAIDRHAESPAIDVLASIGARHANIAGGWGEVDPAAFDLVLEASGSAELDLQLVGSVGPNGVLVLTGLPAADVPGVPVAAGSLLRGLVLKNQAIVGSVNANRSYFEAGVTDLVALRAKFGGAVDRIIGERRPVEEFAGVLGGPPAVPTKSVLTFG
jgi:threonine dehydrogenase-like Zn-dependent dehydrogenase